MKVYLDRFIGRGIDEHEFVSRLFYSYKDEIINITRIDKDKVEKIARESYNDDTLVFVNAVSTRNSYNGYQDVILEFTEQ